MRLAIIVYGAMVGTLLLASLVQLVQILWRRRWATRTRASK
jgi:uncharacterized integral membrane protein